MWRKIRPVHHFAIYNASNLRGQSPVVKAHVCEENKVCHFAIYNATNLRGQSPEKNLEVN